MSNCPSKVLVRRFERKTQKDRNRAATTDAGKHTRLTQPLAKRWNEIKILRSPLTGQRPGRFFIAQMRDAIEHDLKRRQVACEPLHRQRIPRYLFNQMIGIVERNGPAMPHPITQLEPRRLAVPVRKSCQNRLEQIRLDTWAREQFNTGHDRGNRNQAGIEEPLHLHHRQLRTTRPQSMCAATCERQAVVRDASRLDHSGHPGANS